MENNSRKQWLSALATADENYLTSLWNNLNIDIEFNWVREPEIGSVMVQGKAGVTGDNFNVVSRFSYRLYPATSNLVIPTLAE